MKSNQIVVCSQVLLDLVLCVHRLLLCLLYQLGRCCWLLSYSIRSPDGLESSVEGPVDYMLHWLIEEVW